MTRTAEPKVSSGITPTLMPARAATRPSRARRPRSGGCRRRRPSSRPFWMTIDRPKVTSSGGRISLPSVRLRTMVLQRPADREHQRQLR